MSTRPALNDVRETHSYQRVLADAHYYHQGLMVRYGARRASLATTSSIAVS